MEQRLQQSLVELFKAFDADDNGYITGDEISLDNVSAQILEIFLPLFVEMEKFGERLSLEDFVDSATFLYKVSSSHAQLMTLRGGGGVVS